MAIIKIKRQNQFLGMARNYKIFIDGQFVGKIANDATKEFPISAGRHTVTVKIDWCSSPNVPIEIDANETIQLSVSYFKYDTMLMLLGIAIISFFPALKNITGLGNTIYFFMPIIILRPLYCITFGRKKNLNLIETK
jgi:hypothetical protein